MIIMPGYCVTGTVGHKILNGAKKLDFDGHTVEVKMAVQYMSFSAHADAKGTVCYCLPECINMIVLQLIMQ